MCEVPPSNSLPRSIPIKTEGSHFFPYAGWVTLDGLVKDIQIFQHPREDNDFLVGPGVVYEPSLRAGHG